jgi:hypothetical protein
MRNIGDRPSGRGGGLAKIGKEGMKLEDTCSGGRIEDAERELFESCLTRNISRHRE